MEMKSTSLQIRVKRQALVSQLRPLNTQVGMDFEFIYGQLYPWERQHKRTIFSALLTNKIRLILNPFASGHFILGRYISQHCSLWFSQT